MIGLQEKWVVNYKRSLEVALVSMAEKIHNEYLTEHEQVTKHLNITFRGDLDSQYQLTYESETAKLSEKHRLEIAETKKKQWCWLCEAEALYFCCWNTNYCSTECQQKDWPNHRNYCRRKLNSAGDVN